MIWLMLAPSATRLMLQARSMDRRALKMLVPGASFVVHSVFDRAINLKHQHDSLMTLVGPGGGNGPAMVVLRDLGARGLASARLLPGMPAEVQMSGKLMVGKQVEVDCSGVSLWAPQRDMVGDMPRLAASCRLAADLACTLRPGDGLRGLVPYCLEPHRWQQRSGPPASISPLLRAAWTGVGELLPAWRSGDLPGVRRAALGLVGLGPGQTPSGDDLLAGFMVAERRSRSATRTSQPWDSVLGREVIAAAEGRTTDLGLARLRYAAEGELDERSENVLAALRLQDEGALAVAVRSLLSFGHSSGVDTLAGLLLGLGFQHENSEPPGPKR